MRNQKTMLSCLTAIGLLAGCGETGGLTDADRYYTEQYDLMMDLQTAYPGSTATISPDSGILARSDTASYDGVTVMNFPTPGGQTSLLGQTHLSVNFNSNRFNGEITDVVGLQAGGRAETYNGTITIGAPVGGNPTGTIDTTRAYVAQAPIFGNLTGAGNVQVAGNVWGNFYERPGMAGVGDGLMFNLAPGTVLTLNSQVGTGMQVIAEN
jgi:hypothetical protein